MPRTARRNESPRGYRSCTPDMNIIKSDTGGNGDEHNSYVTSPHLLDHGYGATPQNQVMISTPNATAPVKRKLNLESRNVMVPFKQEFKPPVPKRTKRGTPAKKKPRYDTSLGLLTQKFSALLHNSANGVVDLNKASLELNVQKRRIYDITNVLEGIGIIEKKSKNNIQWKGGRNDNKKLVSLTNEVKHLEDQENHLDQLIRIAEHELEQLNNDRHGFVTYQDLRSIDKFMEPTVIVVKAPPEAQLSVSPATSSAEKHNLQVKSTSGEIQVFLTPEYSQDVRSKSIFMDPSLKDVKFSPCFDLSTPPVPQLDSPTRQISSQICKNLSFTNKSQDGCNNNPSTSSSVQNFSFNNTRNTASNSQTIVSNNNPTAASTSNHHQQQQQRSAVQPPSTLKIEQIDDPLRLSPLDFQSCLEGSSAGGASTSGGVGGFGTPFINDNEVLGPMVGPSYAPVHNHQHQHPGRSNSTHTTTTSTTGAAHREGGRHRRPLLPSPPTDCATGRGHKSTGFMDTIFPEPFLSMEPVTQPDYNFSLDSTEGLADLFSDYF